MKGQYTKREIDQHHEYFDDKFETLKDFVEKGFKGVHKRQDKTNGRVQWLEKMVWLGLGAIGVLSLDEISSFIGNFFIS